MGDDGYPGTTCTLHSTLRCLCSARARALESRVITLLGELISRQATVINSCWKGTRVVKQISIGDAIDVVCTAPRCRRALTIIDWSRIIGRSFQSRAEVQQTHIKI